MPALARIVAIAKEAGDAIMRHYQHDAVSDTKPDGSPLTDADRASHDIIEQRLTEWSPHVPIISEEGVIPAYDERRAWRRFWLVDPLDGTKEFLSRNDEFTVNIALIEDGEPVLGAIVAPAVHRCWFAGRGLGSWTERGGGVPTRIWSTPAPADVPLTVVESRSHPSERLERYLQSVEIARRIPAQSSSASSPKDWLTSTRASGPPWNGTSPQAIAFSATPVAMCRGAHLWSTTRQRSETVTSL
jgi:3'(2'), 5'-bisphosphate nucleotidase